MSAGPQEPKIRDFYADLGINENANLAQIRRAYYILALLNHPDKTIGHIGNDVKMKQINAAYEILGDGYERAKYDAGYSRIKRQWARYQSYLEQYKADPEQFQREQSQREQTEAEETLRAARQTYKQNEKLSQKLKIEKWKERLYREEGREKAAKIETSLHEVYERTGNVSFDEHGQCKCSACLRGRARVRVEAMEDARIPHMSSAEEREYLAWKAKEKERWAREKARRYREGQRWGRKREGNQMKTIIESMNESGGMEEEHVVAEKKG